MGQGHVSQLGSSDMFLGPLIQTENPEDQALVPLKSLFSNEHTCTYYKHEPMSLE